MCRNIKVLRQLEPPATQEDCSAAALQYVRKISGYRKPSQANQARFEEAVEQVARISWELLENLVVRAAHA